jgi:uncharacterized protein YciI
MHWLIKCRAKPNINALREATLPAHTKFLDGYPEVTWFSGPLFSDDNKNAIGSLRLIEFPDRAAAETYINADPYTKAGLFESITIQRWKPNLTVRQRDYPRKPNTMQFVIHTHDKPDGEARRTAVREAHVEYLKQHVEKIVARGPLLEDHSDRHIGSFIMLDVADRAEAQAFQVNEPLFVGGVYEWVTMERWRFGHV